MNTIRQRRHRLTLTTLLGAAALIPLLLSAAMPVHAQEAAQTSDSFVDSIGVNTSIAADLSNYAAIKAHLLDIGVRHLRYPPPNVQNAQDLAQSGLKCFYIADVPSRSNGTINDVYAIRDTIKSLNTPLQAVEGVEGPNEPDFFWLDSAAARQYGYGAKSYNGQGYQQGITGIVAGTTAFMQDLHATLKADPATAPLPIVSFAPGATYGYGANPWPNGSIYGSVDYGNMHPYPGGGNSFSYPQLYDTITKYFWQSNQPSVNTDENPYAFDVFQPMYTDASGDKRAMYVTETGWQSGTKAGEISYTVQAKYVPRLFAEYFRTNAQTRPGTGIARTFLFNFADDFNGDYGLLDSSLNPKPAYTALKSLMALLKEPGASFTPGSLNYSLNVSPVNGYTEPNSGITSNYDRTQYVHHLLLQKSNGDYYLVLWHEVSDYDISTSPIRLIQPPALPVTATLPPQIGNVTEYAYDAGWNLQPTALPISGGKVSLNVPDQIVVLKLSSEAAYNGPHVLPGTVQAEDYDTGGAGVGYSVLSPPNGSQTGYRPDNNGNVHPGAGPGGNGYAVGWSYAGDWYKYTVSVQNTGSYTAAFQVASAGPGGTFHLEDETGHNLTGSLTAPNTGGWGNWQTVTSPAFTLGAGTHILRLVEDVNGPNPGPWVCDFDWFSLTAAVQSGGLSGSGAAYTTATTINLTSAGPTDWAHWGLNGTSLDHRSNGSGGAVGAISNYSVLGGGTPISFGDSQLGFTWTNGTPTLNATATTTGITLLTGAGNGLGFTVPASTTPKQIMVYVGGWNSDCTLTATVDGVAQAFTDSAFGYDKAGSFDGAHYYVVYTLTYSAPDNNGRLLHLSWTQTAGTGNLTLMAAADPPAAGSPVTLSPTADAYTRDGTYAAANYGTASPLFVKTSTSGYNRLAYFKFDLTSVTKPIKAATLRVHDSLTGADSLSIGCYGVPTTTWTETGLTWNNQPALGSLLSSATVNSTTAGWTTWDASAYVNANLGKVVTLALKSAGTTTAGAAWGGSSREASTNTPQLVVGP